MKSLDDGRSLNVSYDRRPETTETAYGRFEEKQPGLYLFVVCLKPKPKEQIHLGLVFISRKPCSFCPAASAAGIIVCGAFLN